MEILKIFRNEFKYQIDYNEMLKIRDKLKEILMIDRDEKGYMVRSLYFDSINDIDYYDKMAGTQIRKKIRMRIYDTKGEVIKLEYKWKDDIYQLKESLLINKSVALELIKGNYSVLLDYENEIAFKLYLVMMENCYRPKQIIEYKRIAFITHSKTRITLDYEIKQSLNVDAFFDDDINYSNVINNNEAVLEVKFDGRLELYIADILRDKLLLHQSVSKYALSRNV